MTAMDIDEQTIKAAVCRYGPAERYWRGRRSKAPAVIEWRIDRTLLEVDAVGLARWEPTGPVIYLSWVPKDREDSATVCHEIEHLVMDGQGYPSLGGLRESTEATQQLAMRGNAVLDLVIDDRLRALGFVLSPPKAGPGPFAALARVMGYTTPEQMRAVMHRIVDDHPDAVADGLHMTEDTGAFFKKEYERWALL
jgi:hypothetical protein